MAKKKQKIAHTSADSIPYVQVYKNGIIEIQPGVFSRSYKIPDINFKTAHENKQWNIAESYSSFLCAFEPSVTVEVTLWNKTIDIETFQEEVFIKMRPDNLNHFRDEYNNMLLEKMSGAKNNLITEKILTITLEATDILVAVEKFKQIDGLVQEHLSMITKQEIEPMSLIERLEVLNAIYNQDSSRPLYEKRMIQGHEVESFSLENCANQGITTQDVIAPSFMEFTDTNAKIGDTLAKTYHISNYPTWIKGTLLTDFSSIPTNMLVSVYYNIMDQERSIKLLKNKNINISSQLIDNQKRAAKSGYDPSYISPELQDAKSDTKEMMKGMTKENARLFTVNFLITLFAPNEEAMKQYEEQLRLVASKNLVTVKPLGRQQEIGFASALPLGNNYIQIQRLMTSLTVASIIPFDMKEVRQKNGMYYGLNATTNNMILYDRTTDLNPNGCILGTSGAGKSFAAKREMINVLLNTDDEVYVIDPEREYSKLAEKLGGTSVRIAGGSNVHINPFDMNIENTDERGDPVKIKCDFIETVCEIALGGRFGLTSTQFSIIDRCTMKIFEPYIAYLHQTGQTIDIQHAPTMMDFYNELCNQPEQEAYTLALGIERFVSGGMDIFSHTTNVNINNRFVVYDIKEIGEGLTELGLQICLDNIWNKMITNAAKGKRTWIYIDEFYLAMRKSTSASYISQIWKRCRKWNGSCCAITQDVEDMLKSEEARGIINNCSFLMLLGQAPMNKAQLSKMLDISPTEQKYIDEAKPGTGLLRIGNSIVPMNDTFPKNTELYKIMTTKPDE